eukprot:3096633-Karenia_brevis.AAC.1
MKSDSHKELDCPLCCIAIDTNRLCEDLDASPWEPEIVRTRGVWSQGAFANYAQQDVGEAVQ